jgi:tRNA dimethylallyltransferase
MQNQVSKIIVIMGPTASGKSGVAIKLAQKFDGEVISADSRQIFRGMDIGTGKVEGYWDSKKAVYISENIPHHLIDIANPDEDFNVSHFKKIAKEKILDIQKRGKLPILCGGTAFWIDTLIKNSELPEVPPNEKLRAELAKKNIVELLKELEKIDPIRANTIDKQNKIRLIRALEICAVIGKVPVSNVAEKNSSDSVLRIGMLVEKSELHKKIKIRLDERFDLGMIPEVEKLHTNGLPWDKIESFGLEYRNIAQYLQGKIDLAEMKKLLYFDIIHYAKRQMTWLKKNKAIIWLNNYDAIKKEVALFIQTK